jgi:hypothetical protein
MATRAVTQVSGKRNQIHVTFTAFTHTFPLVAGSTFHTVHCCTLSECMPQASGDQCLNVSRLMAHGSKGIWETGNWPAWPVSRHRGLLVTAEVRRAVPLLSPVDCGLSDALPQVHALMLRAAVMNYAATELSCDLAALHAPQPTCAYLRWTQAPAQDSWRDPPASDARALSSVGRRVRYAARPWSMLCEGCGGGGVVWSARWCIDYAL